MDRLSYFNPFSDKHHSLEDFSKLNTKQAIFTVVVTAAVTLATLPIFFSGIFLGTATFRDLTNYFITKIDKNSDQTQKIVRDANFIAETILSNQQQELIPETKIDKNSDQTPENVRDANFIADTVLSNQQQEPVPEKDPSPVSHPSPEDLAASILQKYIRGNQARKPLLPHDEFSDYKEAVEKTKEIKSHLIPQASDGKTIVYLPNEMPERVLKRSGRQEAIVRFHQMQEVRSILDAQKSSHLIIPEASLYQNFLVEKRLPINTNSYHNMELYISQPKLFDDAVRELTRLFSKIEMTDLVGNQPHPLGHIPEVNNLVRYDNLPLYVVEENGELKGKIGLIDLEHFNKKSSPSNLNILARIFPYHLNIIKEEAARLNITIDEDVLGAIAKKGEKYLQVGYIDHKNWLQQKDVSSQNISDPINITPERKIELTLIVRNELLKLNEGVNGYFERAGYINAPQKNFFSGNKEETAQALAKQITPRIIENIKKQIALKNKDVTQAKYQEMSDSELISLRSPIIKREQIYLGVDKLIAKNKNVKLREDFYSEEKDMAEQLTYVFLGELLKGGEIFYFDPMTYSGGHKVCWIRY